jgi:hypothetical protein
MSSKIFSTFAVILLMLGHYERSSSSIDTQPALKHECHSKITGRLKECSQKALRSISRVLVADLCSFTQNLMQARCSILPSIADNTKRKIKKAFV